MMSSFRMFNHRSEFSGRNQPIAYEAGNIEIRFLKKTTKQKKEKKKRQSLFVFLPDESID